MTLNLNCVSLYFYFSTPLHPVTLFPFLSSFYFSIFHVHVPIPFFSSTYLTIIQLLCNICMHATSVLFFCSFSSPSPSFHFSMIIIYKMGIYLFSGLWIIGPWFKFLITTNDQKNSWIDVIMLYVNFENFLLYFFEYV